MFGDEELLLQHFLFVTSLVTELVKELKEVTFLFLISFGLVTRLPLDVLSLTRKGMPHGFNQRIDFAFNF